MKVHRSKDELEYATNWVRVFTYAYQHLKWLNSFAEINELAMNKIIKKFSKEFFDKESGESKVMKKDL